MVVQYQCSRAGSAVVCRHQLGSNVVRKVFPRVNLLLVIVNLILRNVLEAKHVRKLISFFVAGISTTSHLQGRKRNHGSKARGTIDRRPPGASGHKGRVREGTEGCRKWVPLSTSGEVCQSERRLGPSAEKNVLFRNCAYGASWGIL